MFCISRASRKNISLKNSIKIISLGWDDHRTQVSHESDVLGKQDKNILWEMVCKIDKHQATRTLLC